MSKSNNGGNIAGNRQINANTGVTIGLALAVFCATGTAIYKAGEVITDLAYLKSYVTELRSDVADMKRIIQRIDRQQTNGSWK